MPGTPGPLLDRTTLNSVSSTIKSFICMVSTARDKLLMFTGHYANSNSYKC